MYNTLFCYYRSIFLSSKLAILSFAFEANSSLYFKYYLYVKVVKVIGNNIYIGKINSIIKESSSSDNVLNSSEILAKDGRKKFVSAYSLLGLG